MEEWKNIHFTALYQFCEVYYNILHISRKKERGFSQIFIVKEGFCVVYSENSERHKNRLLNIKEWFIFVLCCMNTNQTHICSYDIGGGNTCIHTHTVSIWEKHFPLCGFLSLVFEKIDETLGHHLIYYIEYIIYILV